MVRSFPMVFRRRGPSGSAVLAMFVLAALGAPAVPALAQEAALHNLMPVPASVSLDAGSLALDAGFAVAFDGSRDPLLIRAVDRMLDRIKAQTGIPIVKAGGKPALTVRCARPAGRVQAAVEDESYSLKVAPAGATLAAATPYGVLRGLETFVQLIEQGPGGFGVRSATVEDRPRFPWRGVNIDVCRHWIPVAVIKRNLDAMAAVKMNVLHWHLSEDQGFRVESRRFPLLHQMGSDGLYYTQAEIRDVVRYAAERGIRVVPEFDMPGHTGAWLVGYPWLSAGKGPFEIQRRWGVFDPVMDPSSERVYRFLDAFIGEMAGLFPDAYFHIGGDEVNGKQWDATPAIVEFRKRNGMKTNEDLQAYFNKRISAILKRHGKILVGWDEVLHPDLPRNSVVQSWRGPDSLVSAARQGYQAILSNGYYLDYIWPAARHYAVDPGGAAVASLPDEARPKVLGGEACMWSEWVTPETIDSRIWPRTAAIAERFWSPATVTDVADMYRRLAVVSQRLDATGITHRTSYRTMLDRLAEHRPTGDLERIVNLVEPVKDYNRGRRVKYTSLSPLNLLVDAARPESDDAREFGKLVDAFLADPQKLAGRGAIAAALRRWQASAANVQPVLDAPLLRDAAPLVQSVALVSRLGLGAMDAIDKRTPLALTAEESDALTKAAAPVAEVLLMVTPHVRKLVDAATGSR
jgi:hexosaminidase